MHRLFKLNRVIQDLFFWFDALRRVLLHNLFVSVVREERTDYTMGVEQQLISVLALSPCILFGLPPPKYFLTQDQANAGEPVVRMGSSLYPRWSGSGRMEPRKADHLHIVFHAV